SQQFRIRNGVSDIAFRNISALNGAFFSNWPQWQNQESSVTFGRIGHEDWRPVIGRMQWQNATSITYPRVAADLSEKYPLPGFNFLSGIAAADAPELNEQTHAGAPSDHSLLYKVL